MAFNLSYADISTCGEKKYSAIYDIMLIGLGSMFIAISAQVAVMLPFSAVPVTGQTFAVLMTGMLMGSRRGALSVLAYLLEGAAGLGVFALGRGGVGVFFGPTGGYLIGFIGAAYITGLLAENGADRKVWSTLGAMAAGMAVIYAAGVSWLSFLVGYEIALSTGFYPFIPAMTVKILLAGGLLPTGWKLIERFKNQ